MYFIISPKEKKELKIKDQLTNQVFKKDSNCTVEWLKDSPVMGIRYKLPDGSMPYFGGTLEPLLRITKKRVEIEKIIWTVTSEFPEYMKIETLFQAILERIHGALGDFKIYCMPIDRSFTVSDDDSLESTALALADIYPELFKTNEDILKKIELNTDSRIVLKELKELPIPYALIMAKLYIMSLKNANTLNNEIMDSVVKGIFTKLEDKKYKEFRSFLLYKFMHGARFLRSGFLPHISEKILIQYYVPLIENISINLETTQFLIGDLIITGINKAQDGAYRELKEHFMRKVLKYKGVVMTFPDLHSFYTAEKTGNFKDAFYKYADALKRKLPATELHEWFERIIPNAAFISSYKKNVLKSYYMKLPGMDRVRYSSIMKGTSINIQNSGHSYGQQKPLSETVKLNFWISLVVYILTSLSVLIYTQIVTTSNDFLEIAQKPTLSVIGIMIGMIFAFGWFIYASMYLVTNAIMYFKDRLKGTKLNLKDLFVSIGAITGIAITLFFGIILANLFAEESLTLGSTETHLVEGLDWYSYDQMEKIRTFSYACTADNCNDETLEIDLFMNNGDVRELKYKGRAELSNAERAGQICNVLYVLLDKTEEYNIQVERGPGERYEDTINYYCKGITMKNIPIVK